MYFASRLQAGRMLANQLIKNYRYEKCAVLALDDGGVMVGAQIAQQLHSVLMLLLSSEISIPREPDAIAGLASTGSFAYNTKYAPGEIDELMSEYHGYVEEEKIAQMHKMNVLLGSGGTLDKNLLRGHNVIIVSDGLKTGFPIDLAYQFLKTIAIMKIVVAVPFASAKAVDRMHVLADELYCLNVVEDMMDVDHYYDKHDVPDHATIIKTVELLTGGWKTLN